MSVPRDGADVSMEDPQLPGVLPDLGGLVALMLARGSLSVVTVSDESSRIRDNMLAVESGVEKLGGRAMCFELVLEKKRGDFAGSRGVLLDALGISSRPGGDAPVRGFFTDEESMVCSRLVRLDDRFAGSWEREDLAGAAVSLESTGEPRCEGWTTGSRDCVEGR